MTSTILIFANPIAGQGRGCRIAQSLHIRLIREGYAPLLCLDPAHSPAAQQLLHQTPAPIAVIVIGGDGTLRAVAEQILTLPDPYPPLLIVPLGTANLMGQHLGIPADTPHPEDYVLAAIRQYRIVRIDTACANDRLFLLMAGIGLDAHIVHELSRRRRGPISRAHYLLPSLHALSTYTYPPLSITADDQLLFDNQPALAFVGNIPQYGTGFPLLPLARPDDNLLDLCILPCRSPAQALSLFLLAAAGEHLHAEGTLYAKCHRLRIDSPQPVPVQIDGDAAGFTPLSIHLLPKQLAFIVPTP